MRIPTLLPCALSLALFFFASVAQAQNYGYASFSGQEPYLSPVEPLIPPHAVSACQFNRPSAMLGTFTLDFLIWERSDVDSFNLVTVDGVDALNAADFDFDESGAIRFTATLPSRCGVDLQFGYLGSNDFSTSGTFTGAVVQDEFFGIVAPITELSMTYEAPLNSFELNLRARHWERFVPLAGLRFVSLDETSLQLDVTAGQAFLGTSTNSMVGFQFGGEWLLASNGPWRLESVIKAGAFYNDIDVAGQAATVNFNRKFSTTSFLGEVSLMGVYQCSPHFSLRAGYQGMWMEGTAMLYDQYNNFNTSGNGSVDLSSVNFQGGFFGFDLTW